MSSSVWARLVASVFVVVFGLAAAVADAEEARKVLNAATITEYPPFESADASGNPVGFDIDLLNAMAAKMGAKVNWTISSFDQLMSFASIKTKKVDVIIAGMTDLPERRLHVNFVNHVYTIQQFFTLRSNLDQFKDLHAVCGKRLAFPRTTPPTIAAAVHKWNEDNCTKAGRPGIVEVPSGGAPDMRLLLLQGRVDLGVTATANLANLDAPDGKGFAAFGPPLVKAAFGIAFAKDEPKLGEDLKSALSAVIADGTYGKLLHKWGLPDSVGIERAMINGQP